MFPEKTPAAGPYGAAVRRLEEDVDLAFGILRALAEQVRALAGEQPLSPVLRGLLAASEPAQQADFASRIDAAVRAPEREGPRQLRQVLGSTWSEAHGLRGSWANWPSAVRAAYVYRALLRRALRLAQ